MATIKDVAERAGVSKGTVSNVFSGKRPISNDVRERVLKAARELNYRANYLARSLAVQETKIISLSMVRGSNKFSPFHLSLLNGVLNECTEHGYRLLVNKLLDETAEKQEFAAADPIDGEIILDPSESDLRIHERLKQEIPFVLIGKPADNFETAISYVDNDNQQIAFQITCHLLELGHKDILFVNSGKERTVSKEREKGYKKALEDHALTFRQGMVKYKIKNLSSQEFAYETMMDMFQSHEPLTAVITDSDQMALGVYQAARDSGITIPKDLSVISFSNDVAYLDHFTPSLSFVNLHSELLGKEAARALLDLLGAKDRVVKRMIVPATFVEQGSCEKPAALLKIEEET
ncbi:MULTISPECIES: LacI family DNA-binding transcriptional regulator [Bacillus]|uniref:Uncharacterized protein n=2 Tax=Bacillus TaxID=1386 RepID=A0A0M4G978_9BACI|nr:MULTISPECIES: LacI family DNA-binding transcriptional regulator [Bacillus]ALC81890.1 hypothetical protein AM592_09930 [Bacillus gobiensis]MBP1083201.1 DNA-binding LacI/PurR family transcriptional regulator [Bacillus capparidis]MED1097642.1 LacI family DNA-binding transcriptional regulator [Bacillus capparidis]